MCPSHQNLKRTEMGFLIFLVTINMLIVVSFVVSP